jgi:hypothetical protein
VIKAEECSSLMGMKWLTLNWHFTPWIEGWGNRCGMRCGARGSGSMAGEARAVRGGGERPSAAVLPCFGAEGCGRGRVGQKAKQDGEAVGLTGPEAERNSFRNKNKNFEFTRVLEICKRRFRRNFDTRIFPKFF